MAVRYSSYANEGAETPLPLRDCSKFRAKQSVVSALLRFIAIKSQESYFLVGPTTTFAVFFHLFCHEAAAVTFCLKRDTNSCGGLEIRTNVVQELINDAAVSRIITWHVDVLSTSI